MTTPSQARTASPEPCPVCGLPVPPGNGQVPRRLHPACGEARRFLTAARRRLAEITEWTPEAAAKFRREADAVLGEIPKAAPGATSTGQRPAWREDRVDLYLPFVTQMRFRGEAADLGLTLSATVDRRLRHSYREHPDLLDDAP